MNEVELRSILEALLFVAEGPVTTKELAESLPEEARPQVADQLEALREGYTRDGRGLELSPVAGGWRLQTRSDLYPWVSGFLQVTRRERLSKAALETLAVVTYHQPLTVPEIAEIRGVDPTAALKTLLEKGLVRIEGRKEVVGRPFLYGTTRFFLEEFGLNSLDDLPELKDFEDLLEDRYVETVETQPPLFGEDGEGSGPASSEAVGEEPDRPSVGEEDGEPKEHANATSNAGRAEPDHERKVESKPEEPEEQEGPEEEGEEPERGPGEEE